MWTGSAWRGLAGGRWRWWRRWGRRGGLRGHEVRPVALHVAGGFARPVSEGRAGVGALAGGEAVGVELAVGDLVEPAHGEGDVDHPQPGVAPEAQLEQLSPVVPLQGGGDVR